MPPAAFDTNRRPGFTLIELIVVMSIFVISVAATAPFLGSFQRTQTVETHTQSLIQLLRRAQHRSVTGQRGSAWGVHMEDGQMVLFAGTSYETRDPHLDERTEVRGPLQFSGSGEVVFQPVTGTILLGPAHVVLSLENKQAFVEVGSAGAITRSRSGP